MQNNKFEVYAESKPYCSFGSRKDIYPFLVACNCFFMRYNDRRISSGK